MQFRLAHGRRGLTDATVSPALLCGGGRSQTKDGQEGEETILHITQSSKKKRALHYNTARIWQGGGDERLEPRDGRTVSLRNCPTGVQQ